MSMVVSNVEIMVKSYHTKYIRLKHAVVSGMLLRPNRLLEHVVITSD